MFLKYWIILVVSYILLNEIIQEALRDIFLRNEGELKDEQMY